MLCGGLAARPLTRACTGCGRRGAFGAESAAHALAMGSGGLTGGRDARRALLAERRAGAGARWSKAREDLAGEPRFQAVPRADREALFREYVAEQDVRCCSAG